MKKINIIEVIFLIIALGAIITLGTIFMITLPKIISKYLILLYLILLGILILLLIKSTIIEIKNSNNNEHERTVVYFKDNSWQSYICYILIMIPLLIMIILAVFVKITQKSIMPEVILQLIYWSIAIGNIIWFYWHLKKADSLIEMRKINLMLKLAVCIVSGVGFLMDLVSKVNFTKQFIVMAWTFLLMSYIVDKKNFQVEDTV